eukprot:6180270-Pleurochrysis_carterae.AAC.1
MQHHAETACNRLRACEKRVVHASTSSAGVRKFSEYLSEISATAQLCPHACGAHVLSCMMCNMGEPTCESTRDTRAGS